MPAPHLDLKARGLHRSGEHRVVRLVLLPNLRARQQQPGVNPWCGHHSGRATHGRHADLGGIGACMRRDPPPSQQQQLSIPIPKKMQGVGAQTGSPLAQGPAHLSCAPEQRVVHLLGPRDGDRTAAGR